MIRHTKMGIFSSVRDRDSSYRRCLGWTSDVGRKLGSEAVVNSAFNELFHKFLQTALQYYREKQLIFAVSRDAGSQAPSAATVTNVRDTMILLWRAFDPFNYGRNYSNTLFGIVWIVAGLALLRTIRSQIGIPYNSVDQYVSAAYDVLVAGRPTTSSEVNRFTSHRDCANYAREILLDIEALVSPAAHPGTPADTDDIRKWLDAVEGEIEGYRSAYRAMTGIDLGVAGTPGVEQQA